jgi:hypothetical protein
VIAFLLGVLGGVVSSLIWLLLLRVLRPRVEIAPTISLSANRLGHEICRFKIVNRSRQAAVHLQIELDRVRIGAAVDGGQVDFRRSLPIKPAELMVLPRFSRRDRKATYAYRLTTREPIKELLNDGRYEVRLRIYAQHPMSGVGQTFSQVFKAGSVHDGLFEHGRSMRVVRPT